MGAKGEGSKGCRKEGEGYGLEGGGRVRADGGAVVCHDVTLEAQELRTSLWIHVVRDSFDDDLMLRTP